MSEAYIGWLKCRLQLNAVCLWSSAMSLQNILSSSKSVSSTGNWTSGTIPRGDWPSRRAKAKAYKFGPAYSWRIVRFSCDGIDCRVRILLNESKAIFRATLGVVEASDMKILCDYEFHMSEPGWHCHARCGDIEDIDAARNRFGSLRIPKARAHHRRMDFVFRHQPIEQSTAFACAMSAFRVGPTGSLL